MHVRKIHGLMLALMLLGVTLSMFPDISRVIAATPGSVSIPSTGRIASINQARSGSSYDIQAAVDRVAALGGGVVYVPEGDFDFAVDGTRVYENHIVGVFVPGGIDIIGAGVDKTILRQTRNYPSSFMLYIDGRNTRSNRISGITFIGHVEYDPMVVDDGSINNEGIHLIRSKDFRIDHCKFIDFSGAAISMNNRIEPYGVLRGVVDHIEVDNPYKDIYEPINSANTKWGYGVFIFGTGYNWDNLDSLLGKYDGVNNIVYVEDSKFSRTRHAITSNGGAWYVARYNTIIENRPRQYQSVDVHGVSGSGRGGRGLEAYNNTIIGVPDDYWSESAGQYRGIGFGIRGGDGVIFNNTFTSIQYGVKLEKESPDPDDWIKSLWIWDNTMNMGNLVINPGDYTENVEYFLTELASYTAYPYPHFLTLSP